MGGEVSRTDFEWTYTPEPHASRRREILAKYPQVKGLFGHDINLAYAVTFIVVFQIMVSIAISTSDISWPLVWLFTYVGGTLNHSLLLAMHEIAHNLAFGNKRPYANRALGIFANLPCFVPASITFRKYHLDHHKYQGDDYLDTDIPTRWEGLFFRNSPLKALFILLQPAFYSLRPVFSVFKPMGRLEIVNITVQMAYNYAVFTILGPKATVYNLFGTLLSMGLHPVAGHFISEHYQFVKGYETYSYYGPLNWLCFNVGYHNEHHDFPNVPGSRLPQLRAMAPEFYDNLPCHTSWTGVLVDFILNRDLGPFSRVKRPTVYDAKTGQIASSSKRLNASDLDMDVSVNGAIATKTG